ncbi:MAG TPA: hypothetical protein VMH22_11195 [bacterium]|nr:hypothetical protein [bacterium]
MSGYTSPLVLAEIKAIRERLTELEVLDSSAGLVLDSIVAQVEVSRSPKKWHFTIPQERPLRFRRSTTSDSRDVKFDTTVDISGVFPAPKEGRPADGHSVVVRIWTPDESVWFVESLDANCIHREIDPAMGRVMHRFHFDAASSAREPWSHFHIGGSRREGKEQFRFPEDQTLPRFFHHPMGLIQTCEFVLYHFFPMVHDSVAEEDSWAIALRASEDAYLGKYLERLHELTRQGRGSESFHSFCCTAPS